MPKRQAATSAFLRSFEVRAPRSERSDYPLNLAAVRNVESLALDPRLTIFVGENGSGKSTLVEGLAVAAGFNPEGGSTNFNFRTQDHRPELATHLRLIRNPTRPRTGFFLRAESFFNVATEIERLDSEQRGLPGAPIAGNYGPKPLHEVSHGESFLALAMNRFGRGGLYILDEPEAALSPTGCLALIRRFNELANEGSQFIIATHSPIVMSFPGALIYLLSESGPKKVSWEELDHVRIMREFLNDPEIVLRVLLSENATS
jgi:predicted ATPase